jgi:hypothetical protein
VQLFLLGSLMWAFQTFGDLFSPHHLMSLWINVWNEDVLYNWMDKVSMFIFKVGRPFKGAKEMHPSIVQALINVCSKTWSFVANLFASTNTCSFFKNSFTISTSKKLSNHFSPCRQHSQDLPKPWVPHPNFGIGYGGFYGGVGVSYWNGHALAWCRACSQFRYWLSY